MRLGNAFLVIGIFMLVFAIGFVIHAFSNPQGSLPLSLGAANMIYAIYLIVMVACFVIAIIKKSSARK